MTISGFSDACGRFPPPPLWQVDWGPRSFQPPKPHHLLFSSLGRVKGANGESTASERGRPSCVNCQVRPAHQPSFPPGPWTARWPTSSAQESVPANSAVPAQAFPAGSRFIRPHPPCELRTPHREPPHPTCASGASAHQVPGQRACGPPGSTSKGQMPRLQPHCLRAAWRRGEQLVTTRSQRPVQQETGAKARDSAGRSQASYCDSCCCRDSEDGCAAGTHGTRTFLSGKPLARQAD